MTRMAGKTIGNSVAVVILAATAALLSACLPAASPSALPAIETPVPAAEIATPALPTATAAVTATVAATAVATTLVAPAAIASPAPLTAAVPSTITFSAPAATPTPGALTVAIPAAFAETFPDRVPALHRARPDLAIAQVADSTSAQQSTLGKQTAWAVIAGPNPYSSARLLCLIPYVPIVHFSSLLGSMTTDRLRAIYQGKDWPGPVYTSGDTGGLLRTLGLTSLGGSVIMLPTWRDVVDRVARDRTAIALVPWSAVDARVKTLELDGKSIAADGMTGYDRGDSWWLLGSGTPSAAIEQDIARQLSCPTDDPVTFMATGDILMGWYVQQDYLKSQGPLYPFRRVRDLLRSADIAFGDFENAMPASSPLDFTVFAFGAAPDAVKGLTDAGIDVLSLANNHMGDYGPQAVSETLSILSQNGIGYVGAGLNRAEARSAWITSTKGITIAILGYNEIPPESYAATNDTPGTAWLEIDNVASEVRVARLSADIVIVTLHMGEEYSAYPTQHQQDVVRRVAEAGADLIIGDHPHVVQAVGFLDETFVAYSLGDFVYVQPGSPETGEAAVLRAVFDGHTLKQVDLLPVYIDRAQPQLVSPVQAKLMMARIFDATRLIDGLLPTVEQAAPTPSPVALLPEHAPAPHGALAAVALDAEASNIVMWNSTSSVAGKAPTMQHLISDGLLNDAPAFSPSGTRLAYSSARDGNVEIYIANTDGTGATNITNNVAWDDYPAWSPDGKQIVFSSNRGGPFKLYIMNTDGSGVRQLTDGPAWDTTPAWSPDSKRIAFASNRAGRFQIFTVAADGTGLTGVTVHPHSSLFPSWSPDGQALVFQTYRDQSVLLNDDANQDRDYELFSCNADGSDLRQLTDNRFTDIQPAWSPDGKRIAFASDRDGVYRIYVMDVDGSNPAAIPTGAGAFLAPHWAP